MHFWMLFRKEIEQNYQWTVGAAVIVLLISLVIQFQIKEPEAKVAISVALLSLPFLNALLKGFYQIRNEYSRNTHYFLRSLPTFGLQILASKYLWIAIEVLLLTILVMLPFLYFVGTTQDGALEEIMKAIREIFSRNQFAEVMKVVTGIVLGLLPLPVMAYFSQLVGQRIGKAEWLVGGLTYLALWWLIFTLYNQLDLSRVADDSNMYGVVFNSKDQTFTLDPQFVVIQLVISGALLLLSGWLFDQQDL